MGKAGGSIGGWLVGRRMGGVGMGRMGGTYFMYLRAFLLYGRILVYNYLLN